MRRCCGSDNAPHEPTIVTPLVTWEGTVRLDQPKYRAFISYSHRDSKWADWLHKGLESYRPPRILIGTRTDRGVVPKRLTPIFRDAIRSGTAAAQPH
jgi:hypothetical protein